ncbi:hypothetical protein PR048_022534 [Dryococelus australis]|uniref:Uncharacterized protein n=1 Tax=Dryococelus australis TaxID=614101 RepID=A0ABQ9H185_9NEOP|nr:hypothetical protein PR048_022534 [Dryococelus australis]
MTIICLCMLVRHCRSKWGQANPVLQATLTYTGPNPISMGENKDLLEFLPFISPMFHEFCKNLRTKYDVHNVRPDIFDDERD